MDTNNIEARIKNVEAIKASEEQALKAHKQYRREALARVCEAYIAHCNRIIADLRFIAAGKNDD
jgi:hypothetical protein